MQQMRRSSFAKKVMLALLLLTIVMVLAPTIVMADLYEDGPVEPGAIRVFADFFMMCLYLLGGKAFNPFA